MLAALRDKLDGAGVGNVEVVRAGFLDYEHSGAPADVVYSRYALHHVPDFWKGVALARLHSALKPGGLLRLWDVVYNFEPIDAEARLEAWCATGGPNNDDGAWSRADYEEHIRDEHSTYTWILEALAQRAGFVGRAGRLLDRRDLRQVRPSTPVGRRGPPGAPPARRE